jgi:hypothetical protein
VKVRPSGRKFDFDVASDPCLKPFDLLSPLVYGVLLLSGIIQGLGVNGPLGLDNQSLHFASVEHDDVEIAQLLVSSVEDFYLF